jgi:hypothetical protein
VVSLGARDMKNLFFGYICGGVEIQKSHKSICAFKDGINKIVSIKVYLPIP